MHLQSTLQVLNFVALADREKTAVLLNLYHIMLLHGFILLGPPLSWSRWPYFFNTVTYVLGCDIISIAELEHNILRFVAFLYLGILIFMLIYVDLCMYVFFPLKINLDCRAAMFRPNWVVTKVLAPQSQFPGLGTLYTSFFFLIIYPLPLS